MIELIKDRDTWINIVSSARDSDFYHTYDYHKLSCVQGETPVLIKYTAEGVSIALPLIIRPIPGSDFFDATSVYGYSGPLVAIKDSFIEADFHTELKNFFLKAKYVSVFSRLNPFIPTQESILQGLGEIVTPGNIVNIDLTQDMEIQIRAYHKRLRTYINKSRRTYAIKKGVTDEDWERFIALYISNMERVEAKSKYFFKKEYFQQLLESPAFQTDLLLAVAHETGETVAGALFIKKNKIVQYHLSGVMEDYLKLNPIKMLIDEMRIRATYEGYKYFNLGGGVANKEDTLFQFKQGFSNDVRPFNVWRYIVNREVYDELVAHKEAVHCKLSPKPCNDFFPCYRCENPVLVKSS